MEIGMMSGDEVRQIVNELVNASPSLVDQVRHAIEVKGAVQLKGKGVGPD